MKRIIAVGLFNLLFFACIFADGKNPGDPRTAVGKPENNWNKLLPSYNVNAARLIKIN